MARAGGLRQLRTRGLADTPKPISQPRNRIDRQDKLMRNPRRVTPAVLNRAIAMVRGLDLDLLQIEVGDHE